MTQGLGAIVLIRQQWPRALGHALRGAVGHHHRVFDPDTELPRNVDARLDGDYAPGTSSVSSPSITDGSSCTSSPIPCPVRGPLHSPKPAASITLVAAWSTSPALAPERAARYST